MSAIPSYIKQIPTDARNFVPISCLMNVIYGLNEATTVLSPAPWASGNVVGGGGIVGSKFTSSIAAVGAGKLRDMGKTYVSSGRAFRKVQLIVPATTGAGTIGLGAGASTFGVSGDAEAVAPTSDYLTGYIELGWEGQNTGAPVARAP
jgi:hypothetical protein